MILDAEQMFDSPSAPIDLAQVVGTYPSTNVIDYGIVAGIPSYANGGGARDMGIGDRPALKLLCQVQEAFTSGGAGTLQIHVQFAPDDGVGGVGTFETAWSSKAYALADVAVVGARLLDMDYPRPGGDQPIPRFTRLLYQIAGATMTAGALVSGVVIDRDDQPRQSAGYNGGYPAGINIDN